MVSAVVNTLQHLSRTRMLQRYGSVLAVVSVLVTATALSGVEVKAQVDASRAGENRPIEVIVTVVRDANQRVDIDSFTFEGKPISVEHMGDSTQSAMTIINGKRTDSHRVSGLYKFRIPGQPAGLYVLGPVGVDVSGNRIESDSTTYSIKGAEKHRDFALELSLEGGSPLYPGQRVKVRYRILFKENIELTVEELPLLEAKGLRKVGTKLARSFIEDPFQVHEIVQEVEAVDPGEYRFGESIVEGFAYEQDFFGRRRYKEPRLRAVAEAMTLTVNSFPEEGMPPSFNGAVGRLTVDVSLKSSAKVSVGDKVLVSVRIVGGDLHTAKAPDLTKQEAFQGRFRFSDLPPVGEYSDGVVTYLLELRPLAETVDAVPAIEYSYFDPTLKQYQQVKSKAIPLQVTALRVPDAQDEAISTQGATLAAADVVTVDAEDEGWRDQLKNPAVIDIAGSYVLDSSDFGDSPKSSVELASYLLLIFSIYFGQKWIIQWLRRQRRQRRRQQSRRLVREALKDKDDLVNSTRVMEKALLLRLLEKDLIEESVNSAEELPTDGLLGEVRRLLIQLEECRFAGSSGTEHWPLLEQGARIIEKIQ